MSKGRAYWLSHLEALASEGIEATVYAKREGLSVGTLYEWRKRLRQEHQVKRLDSSESVRCANEFVPVSVHRDANEMVCKVRVGHQVELSLSHLPAPAWLAALLREVG